jgi:XapX domain-containing protein
MSSTQTVIAARAENQSAVHATAMTATKTSSIQPQDSRSLGLESVSTPAGAVQMSRGPNAWPERYTSARVVRSLTMRNYVSSLMIGLAVGVVYGLLKFRSPAPPLIALVGLLGMLVGEQAVSLVRGRLQPQPSPEAPAPPPSKPPTP